MRNYPHISCHTGGGCYICAAHVKGEQGCIKDDFWQKKKKRATVPVFPDNVML